jgi:hypothetical protein
VEKGIALSHKNYAGKEIGKRGTCSIVFLPKEPNT